VLVIIGLTLCPVPRVRHLLPEDRNASTKLLVSFSSTGWLVTGVCAVAALILIYVLLRKMSIYNMVKDVFQGLWQG
jgi:hypothetical protein